MKFLTLWTDDWIAGTHPLTPEERGVLITIVCHFTNKDRVVPDDDIYLARLCNVSTRAYRRIKKTLIEGDFVDVRKGHLWVEKTASQFEKDQSYSKKQAEKAKLKARYEKGKLLKQKKTVSAIPSPSPEVVKEDTNVSSKKSKTEYPIEFDEAWKQYPRRSGDAKKEAFGAWNARVKAGHDPSVILAGVLRYSAFVYLEGNEGTRFIKKGATFFGPSEFFLEEWAPTKQPPQQSGGGQGAEIKAEMQRMADELAEKDRMR